MPHDSDVKPTSHARHDPLLVAALAAGDLAASDRDHATILIETCAECATLHDDLRAIARATSAVPPPIGAGKAPRDFRLTPEQAERLRPSGWRRVLAAFAGPRLQVARPLGIGLTTIGLAGLLIVNVPLGMFGGSASAPTAVSGSGAGGSENGSVPGTDGTDRYLQRLPAASAAAAPAASGAPVPAALGSAAASAAPASSAPEASSSTDQTTGGVLSTPGASPTSKVAIPDAGEPSRTAFGASEQPASQAPASDQRSLVFAAAILVGLGLLVLRRVARSVTSV